MKNAALLLAVLAAATAVAGIDPDSDSMGIYFDLGGNQVCRDVPPFTIFPCYLLLVNPSAPTCGYECTVVSEGAPYFLLATELPVGALDLDPSVEGFSVTSEYPFPANDGAVALVSWSYLVQAATPLRFYLSGPRGPWEPSRLPVVGGCDGTWRRCGVSTGDMEVPVAVANGGCGVVADEATSFGTLKGLFR